MTQHRIITPDVSAKIVANMVKVAPGNPDLAKLLVAELRTGLMSEFVSTLTEPTPPWGVETLRHALAQLHSLQCKRATVDQTVSPELVADIVSYCAEAPRSRTAIADYMRRQARFSDWKMTSLLRTMQTHGLLRNLGTPLKHQWVAPQRPSNVRSVAPAIALMNHALNHG